ncbi:hypothetical protein [Millionella massiliensis]|uniref:hypothetical protein n=1 Tax=Millionella massiliensis TaxID=1871023 RepID=UPI0008D99C86|nr:hypothetical protein [Millionella massiliensis]
MPAGIKYETAPAVMREVCDETTIYRINDGGMDLDKTNLPVDGWLPELAPLYRDKAERRAHVCLRVKVLEEAATSVKVVKVAKNPLVNGTFLKAGMYLSDGTNVISVAAVDTSKEGYDEITAAENFTAALTVGAILVEAKSDSDPAAKYTPNCLSYGVRKLSDISTVACIGRVFGIVEDELYIPVTEADKEALGDRFMFI